MLDRLLALRRITSSGQYSPAIDGIRFIAIFFVLWQHSFERASRTTGGLYGPFADSNLALMIARATPGVEIFFALSGYILYKGLRRAIGADGKYGPGYLKKYFTRRVTRIEPPYVIALTGVFLVILLTHASATDGGHFGKGNLPQDYLASLFYLHNLIFGERSRILGIAWTLEIEVQFYLLAPLGALLFAKMRNRFGALGGFYGILGMIVVAWLLPDILLQRSTVLTALPYFLGGILFAELEACNLWHPNGYAADLWTAVALGLLMAWRGQIFRLGIGDRLFETAMTFCVFFGPLYGKIFKAFCSNLLVAFFGGMCYSIYLVHLEVMEPVSKKIGHLMLGKPLPLYMGVQMLLLMVAALFFSLLFYLAVERPCMVPDWPAKLLKRMKGEPSPAAA